MEKENEKWEIVKAEDSNEQNAILEEMEFAHCGAACSGSGRA